MTTEDTTRCRGNDPACPCQDGDVCHYADDPKTSTAAWPIPNEAKRVTTTEDNKDQGAAEDTRAEVIANQLVRGAGTCPCSVCAERREDAHRILLELAEAGYTVVKTEAQREGGSADEQ